MLNYIEDISIKSDDRGTNLIEFKEVLKFEREIGRVYREDLYELNRFLKWADPRNQSVPRPFWVHHPPIDRQEKYIINFRPKLQELIQLAKENNCGLIILPSWVFHLTRTEYWRIKCKNCNQIKKVNLDLDPEFGCIDKRIYNPLWNQDIISFEMNQNIINF